jgi:hypothetical protein
MEETSTNIHIGLVRRNKFLRENPISWQFSADELETVTKPRQNPTETAVQQASHGQHLSGAMTGKRNDRARTGA